LQQQLNAKLKSKLKESKPKNPLADKLKPASLHELRLESDFKKLGIEFVREHRFHPTRKWRFDFYLPAWQIAIEADGGVYSQGRHTRPEGFIKDREKFAEAAILGITVLAFAGEQIKSGYATDAVNRLLQSRGWVCNNQPV